MKIGLCGIFMDFMAADSLCEMALGAGFEAVSLSGRQFGKPESADGKAEGADLKDGCLQELCWRPEDGVSLADVARKAEKLGASVLVIPGHCVSALEAEIRSVAETTGLQIAFENSCEGEDLAGLVDQWNASPGSERIYACLNTGHALVCGEKPERMVGKLGKRLISVHANDNHGRDDYHLMPYRGRNFMDWTAFLIALADNGYEGIFYLDVYSELARQSRKLAEGWFRSQACLAGFMRDTALAYREPETRILKIKEWLREELKFGTICIVADVTYLNLVERLTPEGYLPESITGCYEGAKIRTAGVYALLMLENGKEEAAERVLSHAFEQAMQKEEKDAVYLVLAYAKMCLEGPYQELEEKYYDYCSREILRYTEASRSDLSVLDRAIAGAAVDRMRDLAAKRGDALLAGKLEAFTQAHPEYADQCRHFTESEQFVEVYDEPSGCTIRVDQDHTVYSGAVGRMIEEARLRKDYEEIRQWALFLRHYHKENYNLAELFAEKDGKWTFRDYGNAEQGAWFCMMAYRLRRELESV